MNNVLTNLKLAIVGEIKESLLLFMKVHESTINSLTLWTCIIGINAPVLFSKTEFEIPAIPPKLLKIAPDLA